MNCPQCGTNDFEEKAECRSCGFNTDQVELSQYIRLPMKSDQRDLLNGVGLGCSVLCFLWFFVESLVFALAAHNPVKWSIYGPILSVGLPVAIGLILYLLFRDKRSTFSRGIFISLLITVVLALAFAVIGTRYHDTKPPANGSGNGFE
jgi:hypothetical protein